MLLSLTDKCLDVIAMKPVPQPGEVEVCSGLGSASRGIGAS
jgi:hypothetical protein